MPSFIFNNVICFVLFLKLFVVVNTLNDTYTNVTESNTSDTFSTSTEDGVSHAEIDKQTNNISFNCSSTLKTDDVLVDATEPLEKDASYNISVTTLFTKIAGYIEEDTEKPSANTVSVQAVTFPDDETATVNTPDLTSDAPRVTFDGYISQNTLNTLLTINIHVWVPLCAIGILLNIFIILVFTDKRMRNATSTYLTAISIFQIAHMTSTMVLNIYKMDFDGANVNTSKFINVYKIYMTLYINVAMVRTIYCLVMLVAMERMFAFVCPRTREQFRFVEYPVTSIFVVSIVVFIFHIFSVLKYAVYETATSDGDIIFGFTESDYDFEIINNFSFASKIVFVYIPLIGMLLSNIILSVSLIRMMRSRKHLQEGNMPNRSESRERQTTISILISTIFFMLLNLPTVTNSLINNILSSYLSNYYFTFQFANNLGHLMGLISFSTDFITYIIMSTKFRRTFIKRCSPCVFKRVPTNSHPHGSIDGCANAEF